MAISNDQSLRDLGVGVGILIGSVTTVFSVGFYIYVHLKLFAVPEDLFTGPMFRGNPAIFRQGLATSLCCTGAGIGCILSAFIFKADTLGAGIFSIMPGITGCILIIGLWKRLYKTSEIADKR